MLKHTYFANEKDLMIGLQETNTEQNVMSNISRSMETNVYSSSWYDIEPIERYSPAPIDGTRTHAREQTFNEQ